MEKMDALGGKRLHAVYITNTYWETAAAASELYTRIVERRNWGEKHRAKFIKLFHAFFTNTKVIMREEDSQLVTGISNEFKILRFRNNNELMELIELWEQYSERVQESPLMELIKGAMVMHDE